MLGWTGDQLRAATLAEFVLATEGFLESKGIQKQKLMSRGDLLDLIDRFGA